jgi:hypothetical protein
MNSEPWTPNILAGLFGQNNNIIADWLTPGSGAAGFPTVAVQYPIAGAYVMPTIGLALMPQYVHIPQQLPP